MFKCHFEEPGPHYPSDAMRWGCIEMGLGHKVTPEFCPPLDFLKEKQSTEGKGTLGLYLKPHSKDLLSLFHPKQKPK